jgi:eukaryotic-like serine/threonine-protein kinase
MRSPVNVGDVLAEKFEVTKILGVGGMGIVVAARHRELDKLVALKFMHDQYAASDLATDRFIREARAAARLRSEHIGQVLDVGRLPSGVPFIVMEYLEGCDLWAIAEQRGPLSIRDAVEYVLQACEAMAEAHAQGIIHRDLKPQNLFLTKRPDGGPLVKVLDFGISKAQYAHGPTATQQSMGTPAYMAPEQMRSARMADARADIWSLGVILYQLLSGKLPFEGETVTEIMLKAMTEQAPSLASIRSDVSLGLSKIVERCLEKDRERRFSTVEELVRALTPFAIEERPAPIAPGPLAETVLTGADSQASSMTGSRALEQTTLGSAASILPGRAPTNRMRLLALFMFAAVGSSVLVALAARRNDGEIAATSTHGASPTLEEPAVNVDATRLDAGVETVSASPPDDAYVAETLPGAAHVDAAVHRAKPSPPRRRIAVDAGVSMTAAPDAYELTPVGD